MNDVWNVVTRVCVVLLLMMFAYWLGGCATATGIQARYMAKYVDTFVAGYCGDNLTPECRQEAILVLAAAND
jgi:hypothetical protein